MPRLFTAIEIPELVRERLVRLRTPLPGARWIEPESLHITLRFAGDVDNLVASELASALGSIDTPAFEARLAGVGAFGGNAPRTIWAGIEAGPELDLLARANERAARNAGLEPEKRPFKAHVSLARLRNTRPDAVARFLESKGGFASEPFLVDRFLLMSSRPNAGGGPYVVEASYPLAGSWGLGEADADAAW